MSAPLENFDENKRREKAIKSLAADFISAQLRYRDIHNSLLKSNIVESAVEIATKLHDFKIAEE